jgi:hypothetical protein
MPSCGSIVEFARVLPEGEVGMISEDYELVSSLGQVGSLVFKGFYHR